jgi:hypothetical protein
MNTTANKINVDIDDILKLADDDNKTGANYGTDKYQRENTGGSENKKSKVYTKNENSENESDKGNENESEVDENENSGIVDKTAWSETKRLHDNADLYTKQIELVRDMHHIYKDELAECFRVVSEYIIRHKRILVGGMAIDHALRAKGTYLYETEKVDYDFISPEFHKDAYNIGQELAKKFSGISIILARHISTMRVRYEFIPVADITYVPQDIYDKIPVLDYMGIRNVHPHFQMIDQHSSMRNAFENPPQETIISDRYEKDVKRYLLLSQFYPIEIPKGLKVKLKHYELPYNLIYGNCLSGYAAAIYWIKKMGIDTNANIAFLKKKLQLSIPDDGSIIMMTNDFKSVLAKFKDAEITYYNSFLDKIPRYIEVKTADAVYHIQDTKGEKIVAEDLAKVHILGLAGTMQWLLLQGIFYKNEWCFYLYKQLRAVFVKEGHKKYIPSFKCYGKFNWSDSYLLNLDKQLQKLGYKKIDKSTTPRNFHPDKGDIIPEDAYTFNPSESPMYQHDAKKCEPFEEIKLPE